jgi:hypothetical protein
MWERATTIYKTMATPHHPISTKRPLPKLEAEDTCGVVLAMGAAAAGARTDGRADNALVGSDGDEAGVWVAFWPAAVGDRVGVLVAPDIMEGAFVIVPVGINDMVGSLEFPAPRADGLDVSAPKGLEVDGFKGEGDGSVVGLGVDDPVAGARDVGKSEKVHEPGQLTSSMQLHHRG